MSLIRIRKITKDDTDNILKWRNSKHIMNVFINRDRLTKKIHENWLKNYVETGRVVQYIINDEEKNIDIGSIYLRDVDNINRKAELGIFIGEKDYLGKSIGIEATKKIIRIGFEELGLNKIYARVLEYNDTSYKMFMKLGFKQDALLRQDVIIEGKPISVYLVSLLKKEWEGHEM